MTAEPGRPEPRCLKITRRPAPERLFTPAFIALGVADLCYFTGFGIAIFALPLYVTGPVGGGEALAGLAFGAFALSAFVLRPFVGRLCDLHGRRPFLVGGAPGGRGAGRLVAQLPEVSLERCRWEHSGPTLTSWPPAIHDNRRAGPH